MQSIYAHHPEKPRCRKPRVPCYGLVGVYRKAVRGHSDSARWIANPVSELGICKNVVHLLSGYVNGISEHPECPAPPAGKAGLSQTNFRPVTAGAGDGLVDGAGLLLGNLASIAKNLDQRKACTGRRGNLDSCGSRPGKKVTGSAGGVAA